MFNRLMMMLAVDGYLRAPESGGVATGGGGGGGVSGSASNGGSSGSGGQGGGGSASGNAGNGGAGPSGGAANPAGRGAAPSSGGGVGASRGEGTSTGQGEGGAQRGEAKPPAEKHKVKRGGKEAEYDLETMRAMLSDDYEHELQLSKDQQQKMKWPDIVRAVQRSHGAEDLMRQAAAQRKQLEERAQFARENPVWAMKNLIGIEDPAKWANDHLLALVQEEEQLLRLRTSDNPADQAEFIKLMDKRADDRKAEKEAFETAQKKRSEAAAEFAANEKKGRELVGQRLADAKLPTNDRMFGHVEKALRRAMDLGYRSPDPVGDAIAEAKESYLKETFGWFDEYDDEGLFEALGEQRRERLRKLELAKLEGKKNPKAKEKDDGDPPPKSRSNGGKEVSEAELRRSWRS